MPPRCGKNPASSKSSSGGSGNPVSIHPRTKSIDIFRDDRIWTTIPGCQTCRKHSFETLIFKHVYLDTMMNVKEKRWEQRTGMSYFQYWEENSKINWKENSHVRIGCVAFTAEASKQGSKSVKLKMENWAIFVRSEDIQVRYLFHQDWWITWWFLTKGKNSSTPWIEHEINTLLQKLDWWQKLLILFQQRCQRSRRSYRCKETEEGEVSNSLKTWAKCRVLNSLVRNARTNFGRQRLSHHYVPVYAERMRRKSCQRKWKRELFARQLTPRKDLE